MFLLNLNYLFPNYKLLKNVTIPISTLFTQSFFHILHFMLKKQETVVHLFCPPMLSLYFFQRSILYQKYRNLKGLMNYYEPFHMERKSKAWSDTVLGKCSSSKLRNQF